MAITVTSNLVYSDKNPSREEREAGVTYVSPGARPESELKQALTAPDLVDEEIEDRRTRLALDKDQGNISITVLPGEHLGQLSVNVQFEGKSGERELCLEEQDALLLQAADWLREILGEFGCAFRARVESVPCPHAKARLHVELAANRLQGVDVNAARDAQRDRTVQIEPTVQRQT